MMHTIMAFALSIISPDRKVSLNQRIISWKVASCDTLVISRIQNMEKRDKELFSAVTWSDRLIVDISRSRASNCAGKPPESK